MKISPAAIVFSGELIFATFLAILTASLIFYLPPTVGGIVRVSSSLLVVEGLLLGITSLTERTRTRKILVFVGILALQASLIATAYSGFVSDDILGTPGTNATSVAALRIDRWSVLGISYLIELLLFLVMMELYFAAFVTSDKQSAPSQTAPKS